MQPLYVSDISKTLNTHCTSIFFVKDFLTLMKKNNEYPLLYMLPKLIACSESCLNLIFVLFLLASLFFWHKLVYNDLFFFVGAQLKTHIDYHWSIFSPRILFAALVRFFLSNLASFLKNEFAVFVLPIICAAIAQNTDDFICI